MAGVISDLKAQARILHRQIVERESRRCGSGSAVARVQGPDASALPASDQASALPGCRRARTWLPRMATRRWCSAWHRFEPISGRCSIPDGADAHWNIWSASYDEARAIREQHGGYLLAYRQHFFIVDRHFIETLGLHPDDPDWELIGRDWVKPQQADARERLYATLIRRWALSANVK